MADSKATLDLNLALVVNKIVVGSADEADVTVLILGHELPAPPPRMPDRHAYRMSLSQLRELRSKLDVAIASIESHDVPKH